MKDRAKTKCGLCAIFIRKPTMITVVSCLIWASFCFCAWNQSSPGGHKAERRRFPLLFLPGANTHGVKHQSELSWFYQLPLLDLPLETLLSSVYWQTLSYQEQECFSGQNREADKFTALKSFAKVVTPTGLRAMWYRSQEPQSRTLGADPPCHQHGKRLTWG